MKKIIPILFAVMLLFVPAADVCAEGAERLVDMADLLTDSEEAELLQELNEISERQQFDIIVVTTTSLDGKSAMEYADDFYDDRGYGVGPEKDGALLLVDMDSRQWWISTSGYGITAFTDAGIDYIGDELLPYLSDGEYYEALSSYAKLCDDFVTQARDGEAYDVSDMPRKAFPAASRLGMSALIGVIVGFVGVTALKGQMESVRGQNTASSYVAQELDLHTSRDRFLYVHRHRERLPEQENRSGGSSTHISSSGRGHGGGGGKF